MSNNVNLVKRTRALKEDFLMAHNKVAQNKNVSFEARGLLLMLLSLPSDWVLHKSWIMKEYGIGRDKLNRMFKELKDNGYLVELDMIHADDGKFKGKNYMVYDAPQNGVKENSPMYQKTSTAEPLTAEPSTANSTTTKYIPLQSTYTEKENTHTKEKGTFLSLSDAFSIVDNGGCVQRHQLTKDDYTRIFSIYGADEQGNIKRQH